MAHRIVIIGGGPAGHDAAFHAAAHGAEVTLIEKHRLGGTCLNVGCIPTKTILQTASILNAAKDAARFGITGKSQFELDCDALRLRKEGVVDGLVAQLEGAAKSLKLRVISGEGSIVSPTQVKAVTEEGEELIEADAILISTGSVPFKLPSIDHSHPLVWTSDEAVALTEIPKEIIIIGGGIIGCELACAYASFGTKVSLVELAPTIVPGFDKRIIRHLTQSLEDQGVVLHTGDSLASVEYVSDTRIAAVLNSGARIEADILLSAVGRIPATAGLGLAELGLEMDRAAVKVNEFYQSSIPSIFAAGDAIAGQMLAHTASAEGEAAIDNMLAWLTGEKQTKHVDTHLIPSCIYTFPEVAGLGRSADSLKEAGIPTVNGIAKYSGNGKALGAGEEEGFVSILAHKETGEILGASILGAHAVELIHEISLAMYKGQTVFELAEPVYAHPTLSELVKAAAKITAKKIK